MATLLDKCIACYACVAACKTEFNVPLGFWRLNIQEYVEGEYPNLKAFLVHLPQCYHCENAPCVNVCPTNALRRTEEGIVSLNKSLCIGCKNCVRACPFNAIYIDPRDQLADKCTFCEHRVRSGLLPACVAVCPTAARVFGDLDDPASPVGALAQQGQLKAVGEWQGTKPKLFFAPMGTLREPTPAKAWVGVDSKQAWLDRAAQGGEIARHYTITPGVHDRIDPDRPGLYRTYKAVKDDPVGSLSNVTGLIKAITIPIAEILAILGAIIALRERRMTRQE